MVEHGNSGGEGKRSFRVIQGGGQRSGIENIPKSTWKDITDKGFSMQVEPGVDTTVVTDNADQVAQSIRTGEQTLKEGRMITLEDALGDELGPRRARKSGHSSLND